MKTVELPQNVDYIEFQHPHWGEGKNYKIDREAFNGTTLQLLGKMADLYPRQTATFELVKTELDSHLPVRPLDKDNPSRGFSYDFESPNGLGFDSVFNVIGSFPPTNEQYQVLRHFLFQPDLDVRHKAADVIERRRAHYAPEIQEEFDTIIKDDPDPLKRLRSWISHTREFCKERGLNPWSSFLRDTPIKPQLPDPKVSEKDIRNYFALERGSHYEPKAAQKKAFLDTMIRATEEQLTTVRQLQELKSKGELTNEIEERMRQRDWGIEMEIMEAEHSVPYVGKMLGQLWRLGQKEIVQAVSSVVNQPEKFITRIAHREEEIVANGLLASTFIGDQGAERVFIDSALNRPKWRESPEVVTAAARASYDLSADDIATKIMPVARKHKSHFQHPTQRAAKSLCYAIARDVGKERLPKPEPKKLPFFGF